MTAPIGEAAIVPWSVRWAWLYAPSWASVAFAVRAGALLSRLTAMWMEMDSPQWLPLTMWGVATSTREEPLSKVRWRLVGTGCGMRHLADNSASQSVAQWLYENAASMVRSVRTGRGVPEQVLSHYLGRHLQAMSLGLWIRALRDVSHGMGVSPPVAMRIAVFLRKWLRNGVELAGLAGRVLANLQSYHRATPDVERALQGIVENAFLSGNAIISGAPDPAIRHPRGA